MNRLATYLLSALLTFTLSYDVKAQDRRPATSGEISFEDPDAVSKVDSYGINQESSIKIFSDLSQKIAAASSSGQMPAIEELSDGIIAHLTAVYLYCIGRTGVCQYLLDAILEIDIINSRINGTASCPNMQRFWSLWATNNMEQRHRYSIRTGHLGMVAEFNKNQRPGYIKCLETIQENYMTKEINSLFFKDRYKEDSEARKAVKTSTEVLSQLKERVPNLFVATGAMGQ